MTAKGDIVNLQPQLGGNGRAVLTSSSAIEYSFEQQESSLSIYTQYLIEGLRTGIADEGGDGWISVDELHSFAQAKVREVTPAMQPKIYAVEEGYKIILAKAPMGDPKLEYRKEVEQWAKKRNGKLSTIVLEALAEKKHQLGITSDVAVAIQQEVLRPYQEFEAKIQRYKWALQEEIIAENKVTAEAWEDLGYLQQTLGLTDENIQPWIKNVEIEPLPVAQNVFTSSPVAILKSLQPLEPKPIQNQSISQRPSSAPGEEHHAVSKKAKNWLVGCGKILLVGISVLGGGTLLIVVLAVLTYSPSPTPKPSVSPTASPTPSPTSSPTPSVPVQLAYVIARDRGLDKIKKGDIQGAIAEFDEAIRLNPNYAEAYFNRGSASSDLGKHQESIEDYNQAIKLKPDYSRAYNGRGVAYSDLEKYQEAIADFDKAIEINKNWEDIGSWITYRHRGLAYRSLGDKQKAFDNFDQAIKISPEYYLAYVGRGIAYSDLGDQKNAIKDFDMAIKLNPDYSRAYNGRGIARSISDDKKGAIEDYDKAIKINKNWENIGAWAAYFNRGDARSDSGDKPGAIADYDQAIKLKPNFADAYHNRGNARRAVGDDKSAITDYDQAIKLKPDFADAYHNRGNARRDLGDNQGAIADYEEVIKLNPDYASAYNNRGIARRDLGDNQGAIADLQKAVELHKKQGNTKYYEDSLNQLKKLQ
jgi:tetratricopeptide (TPR) repeat protein